MSLFCELISLSVIFLSGGTESVSIYPSTHAVIGNYSQLNPKDCGITRFTPDLNNRCFKQSRPFVDLRDARNATADEAPWVVFLHMSRDVEGYGSIPSYCTGSLISDKWVITAAHCFFSIFGGSSLPKPFYEYPNIYPGHEFISRKLSDSFYYETEELYIHPNYVYSVMGDNDIALIKLDRLIRKGPEIPICLPQKDILNSRTEFALVAGWGRVDRDRMPLQIGYKLLTTLEKENHVISHSIDNQTITCGFICLSNGDSGAPVWQFYKGRAVVIAIHTNAGRIGPDSCQLWNQTNQIYGIRVSNYIDWILNITKL